MARLSSLTLAGIVLLVCAACRESRRPGDIPFSYAQASSGCEHGDGRACAYAALYLRNGIDYSVPENSDKEVAFSARSCDLGYAAGCNLIGESYLKGLGRDGRGVEMDAARATALFIKACKLGSAAACMNLAYPSPDNIPGAVAAKAFALIEHACTRTDRDPDNLVASPFPPRGSAGKCEVAGNMQLHGHGVVADAKKARALFAYGYTHNETSLKEQMESPDGEDCTFGCRGTAEHSSSCIDAICAADLPVGASCEKRACTHAAYCDESHRCAQRRVRVLNDTCTIAEGCTEGRCDGEHCVAIPPDDIMRGVHLD